MPKKSRIRRAVPRALLLSTISVGLFYVFCAYAGVVGRSFTSLTTHAGTASPWLFLVNRAWGGFGGLALLAILNSALVNSVAVLNAASQLFGDYLHPLSDQFRLILVDQRSQGRSARSPKET